MIVDSGAAKLAGAPEIRAAIDKAGMSQYLTALGLMELAFVASFLYPKTMKLGFLLLTCFFAGAIATDLSHGTPPTLAAVVLTLGWIAAFLRDSSIFLLSPSPLN
jgi:hypothetical protein